MNRTRAVIRLVAAVAALSIAVWFTHSYGKYVHGHLTYKHPDWDQMTSICSWLINNAPWLAMVPVCVAIAGVISIGKAWETAIELLCHLSWVLALGLVCVALVAWEVVQITL